MFNNYEFDWSVIPDNIDVFLEGALLTLEISAISLLLSLPIGIIFGFGRISRNIGVRLIASTYVEIMRGVPLLVLLMFVYFGLGAIFGLSSYWSAIVSLAVFEGAFLAEIFRSGIQSVPKGQMEAARSSGMSNFQAMRYIILPQAIRRTLPPAASQFIMLIKDSSLVSVIAGVDLTLKAKNLVSSSFRALEIWAFVAVIYFIMTFSLSLLIRYFEKRMLKNEQ
ncbi:amino acid ABC transporter permease [Kurthia gibsonii]|uniref:Amino acid ABC transporter permease n=1 Tax=Kurthia gibsonii TaxID=33946 RepID=A0ABU9LKT0_9BACL|nr:MULTISPECIES: amino acid ABC transporter permease [Kurthia]MCA9725486.1 amino acid ABC transporter permease [Kurthia sp.]AMA62426.1 amino ABC transporter, permease, 3-TM region, His/Glu/Gln/Arg/opine family domain protein [Kurthia sp. 11kri321]MEB6112943.1 amino acid ABC transporter permease [Kurthia gibsonii]MEB7772003.1 amino acid ABC transporter permease [Kurthia gibsonii]RXH50894.1 amino acid ABC transporter permease [Kurthia gibsonii]